MCRSPIYAQQSVATVTECVTDVDRMKITRTMVIGRLNVRKWVTIGRRSGTKEIGWSTE